VSIIQRKAIATRFGDNYTQIFQPPASSTSHLIIGFTAEEGGSKALERRCIKSPSYIDPTAASPYSCTSLCLTLPQEQAAEFFENQLRHEHVSIETTGR
jgi:hypothetical protein